jgi:hypothetical protein
MWSARREPSFDGMSTHRLLSITAAGLVALAAGAGIAHGQASGTTLAFTATPSGGSGLDLGQKGTSVGDQFFEHGKLAGGGHFQLVTQLVAGNGRHGTEQSEITVIVHDGTIESAGAHATSGRYLMPVVGGTGAYRGARGELAVAPGKHGGERLTVTLSP